MARARNTVAEFTTRTAINARRRIPTRSSEAEKARIPPEEAEEEPQMSKKPKKAVRMEPFLGFVPVEVGLGIPSADVCNGNVLVSRTKSDCVDYRGARNGYRAARVRVTEIGDTTDAEKPEEVRKYCERLLAIKLVVPDPMGNGMDIVARNILRILNRKPRGRGKR